MCHLLTISEDTGVRANGYAIDDEESSPGVKCVAAAVTGASGSALFAISVTTTPARLEGATLGTVTEAVRACAALVTRSFGGRVFLPGEPRAVDAEDQST